MVKKAAEGTWNAGIAIAGMFLPEAITKYYGLSCMGACARLKQAKPTARNCLPSRCGAKFAANAKMQAMQPI